MVNCSPSPELPRLNGAPCEVPQSVDGQGTSSDSEDEQLMSHEGYELLPQQGEEEEQISADDSVSSTVHTYYVLSVCIVCTVCTYIHLYTYIHTYNVIHTYSTYVCTVYTPPP
jgi:hypothetical protein